MTRSSQARSSAATLRPVQRSLTGAVGLALLASLSLSAAPAGPSGDASGSASSEFSRDSDRDGLIDAQELLMRTRVRSADTDEDGYSDLEELARHSSPRFAGSTPPPRPMDVGSVAHWRDGSVHAVFVFYSADGSFSDKHLTVGALSDERMLEIPAEVLWRTGTTKVFPARVAPGRLLVLDLPIPSLFVLEQGRVSLFATVADVVAKAPGRVDTIELVSDQGTIYHRAAVLSEELAATSSATNSNASAGGHTPTPGEQGAPTILVPLHVDRETSLPTSAQGQICLQRSVAVGVGRGVIVHEVVASDCVEGWEGTCASDCSSRVGSTFTSPDPVVYAGG